MVETAKKTSKVFTLRNLITMICLLVAVGTMMYAVGATMFNNHQHAKAAQEYARVMAEKDTAVVDQSVEKARAYNRDRAIVPLVDAWSFSDDTGRGAYTEYEQQLNLSTAMARVVVPSAGIALPVYHGTSPETLNIGAGHLFGTDLPVGGEGTRAVITAHSGLPHATMFEPLGEVAFGDEIFVEVGNETLKYEVTDIEVVLPTEVESLARVEGKDLLTLVTCTPTGLNTHRLLVTGERREFTERDQQVFENSLRPGLPAWAWGFIAATVLVLAVTCMWVWVARRNSSAAGKHRKV